jgi:uncharacterized small protein (DUF1192 family)
MPTADEHLQIIVGQLIIQVAMLKAEIDRLKAAQDNGHPVPDLAARSAP